MKNISMEKLLALCLPLPPLPLQQHFASLVRAMRVIDEHRNTARETLDKLWQSLLHQAFSGSLTKKWRNTHEQKLMAEIKEQVRLVSEAKSLAPEEIGD